MLEHSVVIQAAIEGLNTSQIRVLNRLAFLGISRCLIDGALHAPDDSPEYKQAEAAIIKEGMTLWGVDEAQALKILNGEVPCPTFDRR